MTVTCDFDVPVNTTTYTDVLSKIEDRAKVIASMDFSATSNIPDDAIGYNTNKLERYDTGTSTWSTLDLSGNLSAYAQKASNLSDLANAATARTNLGLGALAVLGSVNNANWSGTALAVANGGTGATSASDARTNLGLGALAVLATINNANWSGTALAVTNGGTGATTAADARTNLGLGTIATLSAINNSNWSGTALAVANGGTGGTTAATSRANLGAAASGLNADITTLTAIGSITNNDAISILSVSNTLLLGSNGSSRWLIDMSGHLLPVYDNTYNLGSAAKVISSIYATGIQGISSADFTVKGQSGKGISFVVDGTYTAMKILGTPGGNYLQVFNSGADSSKDPRTAAVTDWWEIRDSAGNARFIPLYTS